MLTFFRRIRKGLIDMGAAMKYLLYAIGEIALVVIGILIALQINNWNEERKERVKEREILIELKSNLIRNIDHFQALNLRAKASDRSYRIVLSALKDNWPQNDSLNYHFYSGTIPLIQDVFFSEEGYKSLENSGFDLVQNKKLKDALIHLFEVSYAGINKSMRVGEHTINNFKYKFHDYFYVLTNEDAVVTVPIDYERLKSNKHFETYFNTLYWIRARINRASQQSLNQTERVLQLIKGELGETET